MHHGLPGTERKGLGVQARDIAPAGRVGQAVCGSLVPRDAKLTAPLRVLPCSRKIAIREPRGCKGRAALIGAAQPAALRRGAREVYEEATPLLVGSAGGPMGHKQERTRGSGGVVCAGAKVVHLRRIVIRAPQAARIVVEPLAPIATRRRRKPREAFIETDLKGGGEGRRG